MNRNVKLSFDEYVGLQVGRIASVYGGRVRLSCIREDGVRYFIISYKNESQRLSCDHTDLDRLNAHWLPFVEAHGNL